MVVIMVVMRTRSVVVIMVMMVVMVMVMVMVMTAVLLSCGLVGVLMCLCCYNTRNHQKAEKNGINS